MKNLTTSLKIIGLLSILILVILNTLQMNNFLVEELFLFVLIGMISTLGILHETRNKSYSLSLMHWLFVFFFFFTAPLIQISRGFIVWRVVLTLDERLTTELFILLWCVFFFLGQLSLKPEKFRCGIQENIEDIKEKTSNRFLLTMTVLSFFSAIHTIQTIGLSNLFSRATSSYIFEGENAQTLGLLVSRLTRITIVYTNVVTIKAFKRDKTYLLWMLFNFLLLLVTSFPTGAARNVAGTIWLGIIIIIAEEFFQKPKHRALYTVILTLGLIIIFPAISAFRQNNFWDANFLDAIQSNLAEISRSFLSGDYDAFSMVANTIRYVAIEGVALGKQLFGALFFFVPRSIWETKPIGSGIMIFESFNASFTNVSNPLIAEAYVNFGFIGLVMFGWIAGYTCKRLDNLYWISGNASPYLKKLYPFLLPSFFFMLRGDLLSTWAYMFAYISIFYGYEKLRKYI